MKTFQILRALMTSLAAVFVGLAHAQAPAIGEVKMFAPGPAVTMLPMYVASMKGFDKEEGFTASISQAVGAIGIKAMIAGDFDIAMSAGSALTAAVSGAPIKIIYAHVAKSLFYFYAQDGLTSVKALEGKKIGVDAIGGSQDIAARLAMRAGGADPANAVFLGMTFKNIPGAMIAGALDAAVITPPTDLQLFASGKKFAYLGFLGDYQTSLTGGLATTESVMRRKPQLVRAVVRAQYKAHRFLLDHRAEAIPIMAKNLSLSEADAAKTYDNLMRHYTTNGVVSIEQQKVMIEDQIRSLNSKRSPAPEDIFDFRIVSEINK